MKQIILLLLLIPFLILADISSDTSENPVMFTMNIGFGMVDDQYQINRGGIEIVLYVPDQPVELLQQGIAFGAGALYLNGYGTDEGAVYPYCSIAYHTLFFPGGNDFFFLRGDGGILGWVSEADEDEDLFDRSDDDEKLGYLGVMIKGGIGLLGTEGGKGGSIQLLYSGYFSWTGFNHAFMIEFGFYF